MLVKTPRMGEKMKIRYHCTQAELYSVCDSIIRNLDGKLAEFVAYKGKYTAGFVTDLQGKLETAQNLGDFQQSGTESETDRIDLLELNRKCLLNFQFLQGYIDGVWKSAEERRIMKEAAGHKYYKPASQNNWEFTEGMNSNAMQFITAQSVVLQDGGLNMPAAFATTYSDDAKAYSKKYGEFLHATQTGVATQEKIKANNDLHAVVMAVCADGKRVFAHDGGKQNLFVWRRVLEIVTPAGSAGLRVLVVNKNSEVIKGAKFSVWKKPNKKRGRKAKIKNQKLKTVTPEVMTTAPYKSGVSGDDGVVLLKTVERGKYLWKISADGVQDVIGEKRVLRGAVSRMKIVIE